MNQGLAVAGKEVGLMYSFSSQSDDGLSAPDVDGRDLTRRETKIKRCDVRGRVTGGALCLDGGDGMFVFLFFFYK